MRGQADLLWQIELVPTAACWCLPAAQLLTELLTKAPTFPEVKAIVKSFRLKSCEKCDASHCFGLPWKSLEGACRGRVPRPRVMGARVLGAAQQRGKGTWRTTSSSPPAAAQEPAPLEQRRTTGRHGPPWKSNEELKSPEPFVQGESCVHTCEHMLSSRPGARASCWASETQ